MSAVTEPDPSKWTPESRAAFIASQPSYLGFTEAHLDAYAKMHGAWRAVEYCSHLAIVAGRERREQAYASFRKARADYKRLLEASR